LCQAQFRLFRNTALSEVTMPLPGANHWKDAAGIQDFTRRFERRVRFGYKPWIVIAKVFARNKILQERVRDWVPSRTREYIPEDEYDSEASVSTVEASDEESWTSPDPCPVYPSCLRRDGNSSDEEDEREGRAVV
jgi:hypothetical protein